MSPEILRREIIGLGTRSLRKCYFGELSAHARAYESERKRAEALAEFDRAKTVFFSNVSHEFRTPLTLILGPLEELIVRRKDALTADVLEQLSMAHRNALRLMRLVRTVLDFARIEAGRLQARFEPTDLAALTADLASCFRSVCEKGGLELVVDCPPLPEPVHVDRAMWEEIVLNLVSNAFKFTLEGRIEVALRAVNRSCELTVRDTGTGIPPVELPRIFERFHRVENPGSRTVEGSGIGLALVKELAELHGGSVHAESVIGQGSAFRVALPFGTAHLPADKVAVSGGAGAATETARPYTEEAARWLTLTHAGGGAGAATQLAPERRGAPGRAARETRRPAILLADDDSDMRDYARRLLATRFDVEVVADGYAALEALRRRRFALVLADVMMPRLDGLALLNTLRADPLLRTVPVVLLSARAGAESRAEGLEVGADDYLVKPFSARELMARVTTLVELTRVREEAERERAARAAAEEAAARCALIADAGALLSGLQNPEEALARLARLCVRSFADVCVLDLVAGRELRPLAGACADPAKEPLLGRLQRRHPTGWESPHPAARCLRAGEPVWLPHVTDDLIRSMCEDDEHLGLVRALGVRSLIAVPLVARATTLGVLSLGSATPGRYGRGDLDLAQEVARRAALALDDARLYREIQRADQRKSEFIAVLSHELRNPLAPIRTASDILRRYPASDPAIVRSREIIERQTLHLTHLVDDLLDITRITRGKIEIHRSRVDLRDLVRASCEDLRPLFAQGEVQLRVQVPPAPVWLEADATRLSQVVGNLLHNSVKFTPPGGSVAVCVTICGERAEISVRDTGVGMDPGEVEAMFEPFAQAEQGLARKQGGLGLGLALAKGLVELHAGSIRGWSEGAGSGCTFAVSLPLGPWLAGSEREGRTGQGG